MIDFGNMFKQVQQSIDELPASVRASVNKLNEDLKSVATDEELNEAQKRVKIDFIHKSFLVDNGITVNK